jgi:Rieske Fe-S protein
LNPNSDKPTVEVAARRTGVGVSRRDLIHGSLIALAGPCLCSASGPARCCSVPDIPQSSVQFENGLIRIDLTQAPDLLRKGTSAKIVEEQRSVNIIVAHVEKKRYVALDRRCTHSSGLLTYVHKLRLLHCTCWGHSQFALDGAVMAGPAKKKLRTYGVRLDGNTLTILTEQKA